MSRKYRRVIVTGGSGFIGTNLVQQCINSGDRVLNLDILPPRNVKHTRFWQKVDILNAKALFDAVHSFEPDVVLHMAARTDLDGKLISDYEVNTNGVENLIKAIESMPTISRIIFASSRLVCRIGYQPIDEFDYCPTTPYGESKVLGEKIIHDLSNKIPCEWMIVRPTSIWGPWFDVPYKTFFLSILKNKYMHPGKTKILKSFGFIGNTVHQIECLLNTDGGIINGKTCYLADYPPIDVTEMANAIQRAAKAKPIRTVPITLLRIAAIGGDLLKILGYKNPPITTFRLNNLLTPMVHDLIFLEDVVGVLPHDMNYGIENTVSWLLQHDE